jgi:zinc transport system ATP-binding protein
MGGPSIQFESVNLVLGDVSILDDITFRVAPGEVHCIVGTNGGGKTSLVRCMLGQMPHTGTINIEWVGGTEVIGYVPQVLDFDKTLPVTVLDFMAMASQRRPAFLGLAKNARGPVGAALARVGLEGKEGRKLGSLSGGERQRVLLAQALIPEPDLLVLDEPAAGLDVGGAEVLEQIVQECREREVTVIWINHDVEQVRRLADRVTGINRGVVLDGEPATALGGEDARTMFRNFDTAVPLSEEGKA